MKVHHKDVEVFENYDLNELGSKLYKGSYENKYYEYIKFRKTRKCFIILINM